MAWHDAACATLDLEWEDGRPGCRTCERRAPVLTPIHTISPPAPPPDTPRSELVCTWPPKLFSRARDEDDENWELLAFIRAGIDEWNGTTSTRQSQRALESAQQIPQEQILDQSKVASSFRHVYLHLPNADSIRLLRLHGSQTTNDPICCTLEIHRLSDPCLPIFEAFSYTWADSKGDSSLSKTIFLGPQYAMLPVTINCLAALRQFRTAADRTIWVDAICINQWDLKERDHQVSLMKNIYTSAARVLTYVGNVEHNAENTVGPLHDNGQPLGICSVNPTVNAGVILQMPYFSRIWVIQEVILSKTASVTFNGCTVHMADLMTSIRSLPPTTKAELPGNWLEHLVQQESGENLFSLLLASKNCHCGDLRDRVYGLMGLVTDEEREQLPIDYSISVQQLYTGLAMYWFASVTEESQPTPLEVLELAVLPKITPFLPSWAPDWASQSHIDVSRGCAPSTPVIFQFDTTSVEESSSVMRWPQSFDSSLRPERGWTLDDISWKRNSFGHGVEANAAPSFLHELDENLSLEPPIPFESLRHGGALVLDAVHILSTSMGQVELTDIHGKLLHSLYLTNPEVFDSDEGNSRQQDIHLYFLPRWGVAVAAKEHSDGVYSLGGLTRIVCAPLELSTPPGSTSAVDIFKGLKLTEGDIVEHWLYDLFFHGVCAGTAFADPPRSSRLQAHWAQYHPLALAACQNINSPFDTSVGEIHEASLLACLMEIREDVTDFVSGSQAPQPFPSGWTFYPADQGKPVVLLDTDLQDEEFDVRIQQAYETKRYTASSPEDICTRLKQIVTSSKRTCQNYSPLETALSDVKDSSFEPTLWVTSWDNTKACLAYLLLDEFAHNCSSLLENSPELIYFTMAQIIGAAWALLQDLTVDSKFTLEQNFNIVWIHVLTMEMIVRLRGVLEQRLILKAIKDKMENVQPIMLI
ncbi:hypothetical protein G6011_09435 [Alternaria panax]|uniref:Heterokaryon incompatibility domain-containing protein n=1 Tax=Alternaria panax TaxID=48097 RepID=A0AAD4NP93_9PLEO|nr:hypothetical protein G6011_09435 [Alternaria panax]